MLDKICQPISSTLGIENKTTLALAPVLTAGALHLGAATVAVGFRVASIATEFFGKEELSDQIEDARMKFMSFVTTNIQLQVQVVAAATALTTAGVFIHAKLNPLVPGSWERFTSWISSFKGN
jgi:hypothetical protein